MYSYDKRMRAVKLYISIILQCFKASASAQTQYLKRDM